MSINDAVTKATQIAEDHKRKLEEAHIAHAKAAVDLSIAAARFGKALAALRSLKAVARLEEGHDLFDYPPDPSPPDFLKGDAL
jgi:hypothetical protein